MPPFLKKWGPFLASAAVFVVLAIKNVIADNTVSLEDRYVVGIALGSAVLTYIAPNLESGASRYVKLVVNAVLVGLAFFVKAQTGDGVVSSSEWIDGVIMIAGALGVAITVGPVWTRRAPVVDGERV